MTVSDGVTLGDRYVLVQKIGSGGTGDVWRAIDQRLDREVAVKVLRGEFGDDEVTRKRFRFEAQAAASLASSGIASVFDYGEERSHEGSHRAYIVMELVHGESLEQRVRRDGPLGVPETLDIVEQVAAALQVAHEHGLVHRDIKPANLLLRSDGVVKLTDFGIARALDASSLTQTGTIVGTVRYMSPEQLSGQIATPASDLYALGIVAYFCLAGQAPFDHEESMAIALAHVNDPAPRLPRGVPVEIEEFIFRMMAKDPHQRPASARTVASEALALRVSAGQSTAPTSVENRPGSASTEEEAETRFFTGTAAASLDDADGLTLTDRQRTAVFDGGGPARIDGGRNVRRRHRPWILISSLAVVIAAVLAFALGTGSKQVTVPSLRGLTASVARTRIDHLGLRADQHVIDADQQADRVLSQVPKAGTSVPSGARVVLTIASGFVDINAASLPGQTSERAALALTALGVHPTQTTVVSAATPGTVVSVSPTGRLRIGTTVVMSIAIAPPPPTTPTTTEIPAAPPHKKPPKGAGH